jgi:HEAT repeat protein
MLRAAAPGEWCRALLKAVEAVGAEVRQVVPILIALWERRTDGEACDDLSRAFRAVGPDAAPAVPLLLASLGAGGLQLNAAAKALHAVGPGLLPHLARLIETIPRVGLGIQIWILWVLEGVAHYADLNNLLPLLTDILKDSPRPSGDIDPHWVALRVLTAQMPFLQPEEPRLQALVPCLCGLVKHGAYGALARDLIAFLDPTGRSAVEVLTGIPPDEHEVGAAIMWAIKRMPLALPEAREQVSRLLHGPVRWHQLAVITALGELGPAAEEWAPELRRVVQHTAATDPGGIELPCRALYRVTGDAEECLAVLLPLMTGVAGSSFATRAVGDLGRAGASAVPRLLELARSADSSIRSTAIDSLGRVASPEPEVIRVLVAALVGAGEYVQSTTASSALGWLGVATPEIVTGLRKQMAAELGYGWTYAVEALVRLRPLPVEAIPDLLANLNHPRREVSLKVAVTLLRLGHATREVLRGLLAGLPPEEEPLPAPGAWRDRANRRKEALKFAELDTEVATPALAAGLGDADEEIRSLAAVFLAHRPEFTGRAVEVLAAGLQSEPADETLPLRCAAARTLGELGPAAASALPALRAGLEVVRSWKLRGELWRSLARIERPQRVPTSAE